MIRIETFNEENLPQILELCNKNMEFDSLSETLLREKVVDDPDFDPQLTLSAVDGGELLGFLDGVIREIRGERLGYVKLMVVAKAFRRKRIGSRLYQMLEAKMRAANVDKMRVYDVPFNYFMPGIDPRYTPALAFFETLGFKRFGDTSNLTVDLTNQDFNTEKEEKTLQSKGVEISRATYDDMQEIMDFIDEHFALWRHEVMNAYNSLPVSLHIARKDGKVKAFSGHNGNNFGTGWFGPMGTHPDLRGLGLGGILLKRCLQDMKDWGLEKSIIPWVGPIRFYSYYANAVVERVFWRYEKILI